MSDRDPRDERVWEPGWDGHSLAQRRRLARLTLGEKLQWLEEAQRLAQRLARAPQTTQGVQPPPDSGTASRDSQPSPEDRS